MISKTRTFLGFLMGLAFATAVHAQQSTITVQWSYTNKSMGVTTYYPSQALAVAAMQAVSPQNALLTEPQPPNYMVGNVVQYPYIVPTIQPKYGAWTYYPNTATGYSTEAAAAAVLAQGPFYSLCGGGNAAPTGPWSLQIFSNNLSVEYRPYQENWPNYDVYASPQCSAPGGLLGDTGIQAQRTYTCPAYYSYGYYGNNGSGDADEVECVNSTTDFVTATPVPCPRSAAPGTSSQVGDPCDAMSGEFSQTETDYSGPALSLTRYYHSATGLVSTGLGAGWTHNFSGSVVIYVGAYVQGLVRPDGHQDPLISTGEGNGVYETTSGDNIHVVSGSSGFTAYLPDGSEEIYNTSGVLIQLISPGGAVTTLNYTAGLLTSVVGPFGQSLTFAYNSNNTISTVTDPAGGLITYSYDGSGNLSSVKYQDGKSRTYQYKNTAFPNNLTGILDENNAQYLSVTYDSYGRASTSQNAGGANYVSLDFNSTSATVVDGLGGQTIFGFVTSTQSTPRVTSVSHNGLTSNYVVPPYSQDPQLRATQMTDPNGNVTEYNYDVDHLTSKTEAVGTPLARTTSYQYLAPMSTLPTLVTEPLRQTTTGYYPGTNNVQTQTITDTTVTPNVSRTWTYTYNSYGQVLTVDGPRTDLSDVTTYTYYTCTTGTQCGQVETIQNAVGQITTFNTYNAHGQPLKITDPNGIVTTLTYDTRLRLTSRQVGTGLPSAETTHYSYYPTGLLETVTLPDSSVITYGYDGAHRLTDITDTLGNHIHYTLDALGNRTTEDTYDPKDTLRRAHTRVINTLNQLYQDVNAAGTSSVTTTYGYDDNGNLTSTNAPLSRNTANKYDALNRLSQITDPLSGKTIFGYDANDNLTSVQDPRSLNTVYTRNGFGDVTKLTSPDTGTTVSTYDSGGNLKTATDARGAVATYTYDALNRVTQQAYTDQTINYTYDAGTNGKGRLTGASDAYHSMSWVYDALGRVTGKGQTVGSVTKSVGYAYTNNDLVKLVTPSGQTVTYAYTNHQITQIAINGTTLLSGVTYFPYGAVSAWIWSNGATVARTYDEDGKIASITTASDTLSFSYDNAFRITSITDANLSANSWSLPTYDLLDRLQSASNASTSYGWTYDANGNRLTQTGTTAITLTPSTKSNELKTTTGGLARTYTYDATGNTKSYAALTFTYDDRGTLAGASNGRTSATFIYDALGQLIEKVGGSSATLLIYDEQGHLLGEYSSSGALIQETIWMGDIPVATLRPNGSTGCTTTTVCAFYVHTDQLNAPRKVTKPATGQILWRWDTDPFGTVTPNQNPSGVGAFVYNLRFPGQYFLTETGLSQNYFRDYDPAVGRYIESDPIGLAGGQLSTYGYANENPISFADPLGLYVKLCSRWVGNPKNKATSRFNPYRHDYLDVSGQFLGFYSAQGANPAWGKGVVTDPGEQDGGRCSSLCSDNKFDAYVLAAAQEIGAPTYCAIASAEFGLSGLAAEAAGARNCQSWARDVIAKAKQNYLAHEHCPTCFKQ